MAYPGYGAPGGYPQQQGYGAPQSGYGAPQPGYGAPGAYPPQGVSYIWRCKNGGIYHYL